MGEKPNPEAEAAANGEKINEETAEILGHLFNEQPTAQERQKRLVERLIKYTYDDVLDESQISQEMMQEIIEQARTASLAEDRQEFVSGLMSAMRPLLEFKISQPEVYEEMDRRAFFAPRMTRVSKVLGYDIVDNHIGIHLAPARTLKRSEWTASVEEGLKTLAKAIRENNLVQIEGEKDKTTGKVKTETYNVNSDDIKVIVAKSYIVKDHPALIEKKLGFTVLPEDDQRYGRLKDSLGKPKSESSDRTAVMDIEKFLEKYGKELAD